MAQDNAVIRPEKPKKWPSCPNRTAIMVSSPADMTDIVKRAGLSGIKPYVFMNSRMYCDPQSPAKVCIVGPFIGAPYAVMLFETLVAWGVERIIAFGWCGSVCPDVVVGDLVIPTSAYPGDGTSPHYCRYPEKPGPTVPSGNLNSLVLNQCAKMNLSCRTGPIWTTDAVFRETPEIIEYYQEKGALAVEMEASALFAAGAYRGIDVAAVLAVSDEVYSFSWKTGFGSNRFKNTRKRAIELILAIAGELDQACTDTAE